MRVIRSHDVVYTVDACDLSVGAPLLDLEAKDRVLALRQSAAAASKAARKWSR
jgi:hypothetical protein